MTLYHHAIHNAGDNDDGGNDGDGDGGDEDSGMITMLWWTNDCVIGGVDLIPCNVVYWWINYASFMPCP